MHLAPSTRHQSPGTRHLALLALILHSSFLIPHSASAAVPMRWTVDVSRVQPEVRDVVRGETIALEATLKKDGKPFEMGPEPVCIFWQTNGMANAWWSAPAQVLQSPTPTPNSNSISNILSAVFTPAMDPGAATVNGFLGSTGEIYRAAFQLRFRHGPGAIPNELPLPTPTIDFAKVTVLNPPWPTAEAVSSLASQVSGLASSKADRATTYTKSENDTLLAAKMNTQNADARGALYVRGAMATAGRASTSAVRLENAVGPGVYYTEFGLDGIKRRTPASTATWTLSYPVNKDGTLALTSDIPDVSSLSSQVSGLASSKADSADVTQLGSDVSQLNLQVAALGATANAEDARFVSTNYNSSTRMPEAYVDVKVSNSWITVWKEMTRWNWFLAGYANYTNDVASALANKGEREWGWFDSATGNPSPDGILQLSQPRILICSGAAYQRYATASGAAWVLESNGLVSDINGTTNGFFRISDEEGNAHFEIVKGDKQTLFATARTMTQQQMGVTHYFTTYAVTNAFAQPTAEFTRSLNPVAWIREGDPGFPCNVQWTNSGNNSYTVEWWPIGNEPQLFMRCGYERGGETYIRNNAPVSMDYIYLGGVKYRLGTATVSGHTVLTLTQQ